MPSRSPMTGRLFLRTSRAQSAPGLSRSASSTPPRAPPSPGQQPKPTSQHINIYKEFGRPFAKVFLMGMFTYQTLYWAWLAMERDELRRNMDGKIEEMENQVRRLAGVLEQAEKK